MNGTLWDVLRFSLPSAGDYRINRKTPYQYLRVARADVPFVIYLGQTDQSPSIRVPVGANGVIRFPSPMLDFYVVQTPTVFTQPRIVELWLTQSVIEDTLSPPVGILADDGMDNPSAQQTLSYLFGWNGSNWDRVGIVNGNLAAAVADDVAGVDNDTNDLSFLINTSGLGIRKLAVAPYVFDGATWDRARGDSAFGADVDVTRLPNTVAAADSLTNPTAAEMLGFNFLWNGVTWDRQPGTAASGALVNTELPTAIAAADNLANPTAPFVLGANMVWDGANWDRLPGDTANGADVDVTRIATFAPGATPANPIARVIPHGPSWQANHVPGAGVVATCNKAAAGAGVKNVCTSITITLSSTAAPTAGSVLFQLLDGVIVVWAARLSLPAVAGECANLSVPVFIEGTANTAMTLATSAAPPANNFATVAMNGFTV